MLPSESPPTVPSAPAQSAVRLLGQPPLRLWGVVAASLVQLSLAACHAPGGSIESTVGAADDSSSSSRSIFTEEAAVRGLDFRHFNGMTGKLTIAEVMGSGVAVFDYDNDGDLDIYLVQGSVFEGNVLPPLEARLPLTDRLYRNELDTAADASAGLRFTDVTVEAGVIATGYGMGVATGDIDNDGWVDLYLSNLGSNQLLRNRGADHNGVVSFEDVTSRSATDDPRWSVSAVFVDLDGDGWQDLFVTNYVDFSVAGAKSCTSLTGAADYCGPLSYRPQSDRLFHNRGDGTFEDWSGFAGVAAAGSGLGVVSGDFDGNGLPDLYVANDGMPNFLWLQQEDGGFRNEALLRGCSLSLEGMAQAGMGIAAGDYDADGDEDLLVTHLTLENNTLYRNDGRGSFDDVSRLSNVGSPSFAYTGFGVAWIDFDNDGWLDLLVANGAVKRIPELVAKGDEYPVHMPNQLFRNGGDGRFEEVSSDAGVGFQRSEVSRGLATGDLDNDGDVDVVISNNSGPVRLLLNQVGSGGRWLGLRLIGRTGAHAALGSWVGVERPGAPTLWRRVRTDGSYLSASDPRLLIGLGASGEIGRVRVHWRSGLRESFGAVVGSYTTLEEGTGEAIDAVP